VRKVLTVVAALAAVTPLLILGSASGSSKDVHKQVRYVRSVATTGFYVDNDPSGNSGGDLFGSTGDLQHAGRKVGTLSSACTAASQTHAQCQVTFIWNTGDRIQLAGDILVSDSQNRIAIIGGTGRYKTARGDATLTSKGQGGSIQRIKLRILR